MLKFNLQSYNYFYETLNQNNFIIIIVHVNKYEDKEDVSIQF